MAGKTKKAPAKKKAAERRSKARDEDKIKVLAKDNPRREGTDAHKHFEKIADSKTVGEYMGKFRGDDRKIARAWLNNTLRDGHIQIISAA